MKEKGISTLVLVFIIASLLAMIIFVLQPLSLLGARRANQIRYSQTAFFAAEGAIYETIEHIRHDSSWPGLSVGGTNTSSYSIGEDNSETDIIRTITQKSENEVEIDVTATIRGIKRRLVGSYSLEETTSGEAPEPQYACGGIEVTVDNDSQITFLGDPATGECFPSCTFTLGSQKSYVTMEWPVFETYCNLSSGDQTITTSVPTWLCDGICPEFEADAPGDKEDLGFYKAGNTVYVSTLAILHDNPDHRRICITLNANSDINSCSEADDADVLVHTCDDGWTAPPCEYELEENGNVRLIFDDSVGLVRGHHVGVSTETGETFWLHEELAEPE